MPEEKRSELRTGEQDGAQVSRSEARDFEESKAEALELLKQVAPERYDLIKNELETIQPRLATAAEAAEYFKGNQRALYHQGSKTILLNPGHAWTLDEVSVAITHEMTHAMFDGLKIDQLALIIDRFGDLDGLGAQYKALALEPQSTIHAEVMMQEILAYYMTQEAMKKFNLKYYGQHIELINLLLGALRNRDTVESVKFIEMYLMGVGITSGVGAQVYNDGLSRVQPKIVIVGENLSELEVMGVQVISREGLTAEKLAKLVKNSSREHTVIMLPKNLPAMEMLGALQSEFGVWMAYDSAAVSGKQFNIRDNRSQIMMRMVAAIGKTHLDDFLKLRGDMDIAGIKSGNLYDADGVYGSQAMKEIMAEMTGRRKAAVSA
ncbi:MAG TPA: hypothetical protein DIS66_00865 [Candidatus Omnitrophica bacterium]|nr:hypothetical protein [Candidatus Omnitrophota bacterium]